MAPSASHIPNLHAYRGRRLLSELTVIPDRDPVDVVPSPASNLPVCIIGAGIAGLYTAMIFQSLGIEYQIVDADTQDRVGGRLFTYHFPNGDPYDYLEVGAMRFADTPFMRRVFDLAKRLPVKLIPYIMEMVDPPNTFLCYNNVSIHNNDTSVTGDPFNVSSYIKNPDLMTPQGVARRVSAVLQPFRNLFRIPNMTSSEIKTAVDQLCEKTAKFSMRSYMYKEFHMDDREVSWCETLDRSTGWYDLSLTETVLENLAFDWPTAPLPGPEPPRSGSDTRWYCFDKGSSTLPQAMFNSLNDAQKTTQFQSPVTAISQDAENKSLTISINGKKSSQSYSAIISTIPLSRLSLVDLTGVKINSSYGQWSAIRELKYTPAIKIGIKFTAPWWETELEKPIHGGQSHTDLPLRTIVYPSYPHGVASDKISKVLIVSYCWTQDAERMGALINADGTVKPELVDLIFRNLATVHNINVEDIRKFDTGEYFAWDWLHNPLTMGGFALFGPGAYESNGVYSKILLPAADRKLFFAGEATSACHGWVAGALDSAWRAVDNYLAFNKPKELRENFWKEWGPTEYLSEKDDEELVDLNRKLWDEYLGFTVREPRLTSSRKESTHQ